MKKENVQPLEKGTTPGAQPEKLSAEEKGRLIAALETARETVKPTVKRLMESESVSNDILSMRLENSPLK